MVYPDSYVKWDPRDAKDIEARIMTIRKEFETAYLTGDRLPIIRNAVSVESNKKAIFFDVPTRMPSAAKIMKVNNIL